MDRLLGTFSASQCFATQLRFLFHQSDLISGFCSFFGCSQAGEPTAHNKDFLADGFEFIRDRQLGLLSPDHGHAYVVGPHFLEIIVDRPVFLALTDPSDLLAQISANSDGLLTKIKFSCITRGEQAQTTTVLIPFSLISFSMKALPSAPHRQACSFMATPASDATSFSPSTSRTSPMPQPVQRYAPYTFFIDSPPTVRSELL
jgi:hypothetical protein